MVRIPRWARTPPVTRRSVLRRDGGLCVYCSEPADTIDHVIPRSRGGTHDWSNVVAACNAGRSHQGRPAAVRVGVDVAREACTTRRVSVAAPSPLGRSTPCGSRISLRRLDVTAPVVSRSVLHLPVLPDLPVLPHLPAHPRTLIGIWLAAVVRCGAVQDSDGSTCGHSEVRHPTLVLGSTQRVEVVDTVRAAQSVLKWCDDRGGGGAVFLRPDDHLWIEAWVPRADPLWDADVAVAAGWVGAWWSAALASRGAAEFVVHEGRAVPGRLGRLVCFSGKGPGEVFSDRRKVMGVSQWRGREGALFHTCAYRRWDPRPLVELLEVAGPSREELVAELADTAIGLDELSRADARTSPSSGRHFCRRLRIGPLAGRDGC